MYYFQWFQNTILPIERIVLYLFEKVTNKILFNDPFFEIEISIIDKHD